MKKLFLTISFMILSSVSLELLILSRNLDSFSKIAASGDLIFQTQLGSSQSLAIQVATLSIYNHVGVVSVENNKIFVYEAAGAVTKTRLESFVNRSGTGGRFVVYRHKDLEKENIDNVIRYSNRSLGKKYDSVLSWSNSRMYCSELAYKAYEYAGFELETPEKMRDMKFALFISRYIPHSYRRQKFNLEDEVVAPSHLSRDNNFEKVFQNW